MKLKLHDRRSGAEGAGDVARSRGWQRYFWRRKQVVRTTWLFRGLILLGAVALLVLTHRPLLTALGRSVVYQGPVAASDAMVLEHYDPNYLVFERAHTLMEEGLAPRVIVPCQTFGGPTNLNVVSQGIIEVMTRVSRLKEVELVPVTSSEPFTLTTARVIADHLVEQQAESVIVVSPPFRSRRSYLVYRSILDPLGIEVYCVPADGIYTPENWWKSPHGIQSFLLEFSKQWYYRLVVLR